MAERGDRGAVLGSTTAPSPPQEDRRADGAHFRRTLAHGAGNPVLVEPRAEKVRLDVHRRTGAPRMNTFTERSRPEYDVDQTTGHFVARGGCRHAPSCPGGWMRARVALGSSAAKGETPPGPRGGTPRQGTATRIVRGYDKAATKAYATIIGVVATGARDVGQPAPRPMRFPTTRRSHRASA